MQASLTGHAQLRIKQLRGRAGQRLAVLLFYEVMETQAASEQQRAAGPSATEQLIAWLAGC